MFFTNCARIIAAAAFVLGLLSFLIGLAIAQGLFGPYDAAVARYGSSGRMIDRGIYTLLAAVALGTLAEISFTLRKSAGISK